MSPVALSKELEVDLLEAITLADSFFKRFPGVVQWQQVGTGGGEGHCAVATGEQMQLQIIVKVQNVTCSAVQCKAEKECSV
jgi:hypothetical protein